MKYYHFSNSFFKKNCIADKEGIRLTIFCVFSAYRTAICKAKRGGFKDTFAEDLLVPVFKVCNCCLASLYAPVL